MNAGATRILERGSWDENDARPVVGIRLPSAILIGRELRE